MQQIVTGLVAIAIGVGGAVILYWALNKAVEQLSAKWEERLKPYVFIGPAFALLGIFLLWPAIRTIWLSFYGPDAAEFVGATNYARLFTDPRLVVSLINSALWIVIVPIASVIVGLIVAVLADRLKARWESVTKSVIFMPMAIAMVSAGTIWMFIYAWRPAGRAQIGVLNAIWTGIGGEPQTWLQISTGRLNSFLLMVILIWMQAGFAMVLLSAAIKNVPEETLEAARVDGATEPQIFFRVVVPQIASTIMVVLTTITIFVLKIFDIVFVTTGGQYGTEVVAVTFYRELIQFRNSGQAAAVVVAMLIVTIPVMIYNVRQYRVQEAT